MVIINPSLDFGTFPARNCWKDASPKRRCSKSACFPTLLYFSISLLACCEFEAMSSLLINHQSSALYLFVIVLLLIMVIIVHIWSSLKSKAWQLPAPARVCVALYSRFTRVVWYTFYYFSTVFVHGLRINGLKYIIEILYISWLQHLSTLLVHVPANRFLPWSHKFIGIDVNWDWCSGHH